MDGKRTLFVYVDNRELYDLFSQEKLKLETFYFREGSSFLKTFPDKQEFESTNNIIERVIFLNNDIDMGLQEHQVRAYVYRGYSICYDDNMSIYDNLHYILDVIENFKKS